MKKLYISLFILLIFSLSSCVDLEEVYDFHADGSCNVTYNFDMSTAVSVLANLLPDSVRKSAQYSEVKDTTVNFYGILPDTTQQKMDSNQVVMARGSDLVLMMNLRRNMMKASIRHSADNAAELNYYLKNISKMVSREHLNSVLPNSKGLKNFDGSEFVLGQDYYNYNIGPHQFYRTIDKVKFSAYIKKNEQLFKLSRAMLIDMPYKIKLNFPEPVVKVDNAKALISEDRKTVTLETNIEDAFKNPDIMNLKIEY